MSEHFKLNWRESVINREDELADWRVSGTFGLPGLNNLRFSSPV